jgi:hypothetical protein
MYRLKETRATASRKSFCFTPGVTFNLLTAIMPTCHDVHNVQISHAHDQVSVDKALRTISPTRAVHRSGVSLFVYHALVRPQITCM